MAQADTRVGLSDAEAAARLAAEGSSARGPPVAALPGLVLAVLREPVLLLLLACGALYALDNERDDAVALLAFAAIAVVLALTVEYRLGARFAALRTIQSARRLRIKMLWIGLALSVLVAVLFGTTRGDWLRGMLAGLTLALGLLPQELPLVLLVFLAVGAWRLARRHVLTRRLDALELLGETTMWLVGPEEALHAGMPHAIAECRAAGVRVALITPAGVEAGRELARRAGIALAPGVLTGEELERASPAALSRAVCDVDVYCGVAAAQKLWLVETLQASGEVVALTGAASADAPALSAAEAGITLGASGTDVAREAAAFVLLEDDLSAVPGAIREARHTFDNLRRALAFLIAAHVPIVGLALLPVVLGWKLVLLPAHVLLLELVINPACALALALASARAQPALMRRPPRPRGPSRYARATLMLGLLQGIVVLAVVLVAHEIAMLARAGADVARATGFIALIVASVGLIYSSRSRTRSIVAVLVDANPALSGMTGFVAVVLVLVLYVPRLREVFAFGEPGAGFVMLGVLAGVLAVSVLDAVKLRRAESAASVRS